MGNDYLAGEVSIKKKKNKIIQLNTEKDINRATEKKIEMKEFL